MRKVLRSEVPLLTPNGKTMVPIVIAYDDSEVITNPKSEVTLLYNGIEYKGNGADYLWTDTLADLQMKLPKNMLKTAQKIENAPKLLAKRANTLGNGLGTLF